MEEGKTIFIMKITLYKIKSLIEEIESGYYVTGPQNQIWAGNRVWLLTEVV